MSNVMHLAPLDLYARLLDDGARPRLAWSSEDGERLELSGRVLANWIAKTANLLVAEADAERGVSVLIDLPTHWRTLVWGLGTWVTGATLVIPDPSPVGGAGPDVAVTTDPERWLAGSDLVVAVTLPSFALRWPGTLPPAALDGSADVASYPDALGPLTAGDPDDVALEIGGRAWTYRTLDSGLPLPAELAEHDIAGPLLRTVAALTTTDGVVGLGSGTA